MTTFDRKAWYAANKDRINAERRAKHAADPGIKAQQDKAFREAHPYSSLTDEQKERKRARVREYQARNREQVVAAKRRYDRSAAGKQSKQRCEAAYRRTGGRAAAEARRAAQGISEARLVARKTYEAKRRAAHAAMTELDEFVLREAYQLAKHRQQVLGTRWDVDHIVPISKGGTNEASNLQVVPAVWNKQKSNKHQKKFFGAQ